MSNELSLTNRLSVPRRSVLGRQHDCQNARGASVVAGVFAAVCVLRARFEIVEFPEAALAVCFDHPEVVLAARVVIVCPAVERPNSCEHSEVLLASERLNAA